MTSRRGAVAAFAFPIRTLEARTTRIRRALRMGSWPRGCRWGC